MLTFSIDDLMKDREITGLPKCPKFSNVCQDARSKELSPDTFHSETKGSHFERNLEMSFLLSANSTGGNTMTSSTTESPTLNVGIHGKICEGRPTEDEELAFDNSKNRRLSSEFLSQSPPGSLNSSSSETESVAQILLSLERKSSLSKGPTCCGSPEEPRVKPEHSYIALISIALLNSPEKKLILADIYQFIMDKFPYYNNKEKAWRNSVRHNLSLNECFVKNGRAENGKGNYWSIHPACIEDFSNGDYRRRHARRRARKTTKELTMPSCSHVNYSYGYVPMTSSSVNYHPYLGTPGAMLLTPPQMPTSGGYFPGTGLFAQNIFPSDYFHQNFGPIPRQSIQFY